MIYQLKKSLNVFQLLMISLGGSWGGGMIVSSFYTESMITGASTILVFFIASIFMYVIMSVLLEMSVDYPNHGSFVEYSYQYLNSGASFIIGWCAVITFILLAFITAVMFGSLLQHFIPIPSLILSISLVVIFTACNLLSVKKYATIQTILTITKITILVILNIYISILTLKHHIVNHTPALISSSGLFSSAFDQIVNTLLVFCVVFTSLEYASIAGGEAKKPQKTLPKTIKLLFIIILLIAIFVSIPAYLGFRGKFIEFFNILYQNHPQQSLLNLPMAIVHIFELIFLLASFAMLNSAIYAASRLLLSLAKNSSAPARIAVISRNGIPKNAVIGTSLAVLLLILLFNLISYPNTLLVSVVLYCVSLFILTNWIVLLFIYLYFYRSVLIRNSYLRKLHIPENQIKHPNKIKLISAIITIFCLLSVLLLLLSNQTFRLSFYIMFVVIIILSVINALRTNMPNHENE